MDQDQTALVRAVCSGSTLFDTWASKTFQQATKADDLLALRAYGAAFMPHWIHSSLADREAVACKNTCHLRILGDGNHIFFHRQLTHI